MSVLEWIVIGQVLIFVFALIISCLLLGDTEPTEEERMNKEIQDAA